MSKSIENLQAAQENYKAVKAQYDKQAQAVKDHHNNVYAPMCERKRELKEELDEARLELERQIRDNKELLEVARGLKL